MNGNQVRLQSNKMTVKQYHLCNVAPRKQNLQFYSMYWQILRAPRQTTFLHMRGNHCSALTSSTYPAFYTLPSFILDFSLSLHDSKRLCICNSMAHLAINKAYFDPFTEKWYCCKSTKGSMEEFKWNCTSEATKTAPWCPVVFMSLCK